MRAVRPLVTVSLAALTLGQLGCSKLVGVELTLAEPCGQEQQALNGVQSFRVLSSGATPDSVVAFSRLQPAGVAIGLGESVVLSVEGYADDITQTESPEQPVGVKPRSVGRTMPLALEEGSLDVNATVLVGRVDSFGGPRDAEGNCTTMKTGDPVVGRHAHTATFVPGVNKVLLFGGATWSNGTETFLKSAEVYDPATGTFTALPTPEQARAYHTATLLPEGQVLILGGFSIVNGQVGQLINGVLVDLRFDNPYVGGVVLRTPRAHHSATLLEDVGLLAVIGGCTGSAAQGCTPTSATGGTTNLVPSVEIINVNNLGQASAPAQGGLATPRAMHQAVAFPSGNAGLIVVSGGLNDSGALRGVEFLQVSSGSLENKLAQPDALPEPVVRHSMVAFNQNQFVISGGQAVAANGVLNDASPGTTTVTICDKTGGGLICTPGAPLVGARFGHHSARLKDGTTLVVMGGAVAAGGPTAEALRFIPGGAPPVWAPTEGALPVARERAAVAFLGGEGQGFVNQVFYSGGHTTLVPYTTVDTSEIYFGN